MENPQDLLHLECQHIMADLISITHPEIVHDATKLLELVLQTLQQAGCVVAEPTIRKYQGGTSIMAFFEIPRGHISIHAEPDNHFVAVDFFVFGHNEIEQTIAVLCSILKPRIIRKTTLPRGLHI
ncbi:MAG: S-adenosylmethionine decarboxylase [Acidobacteriota bacterium]|nr:S-adenosylmethionine decarboxylase [Blastocatellia bacterium]MDW8413296.1 S-adenosylmethionine decarboxylase [Acidobacteriota bacterium]